MNPEPSSQSPLAGSFKALFEVASPELYDKNPFCLLELPVDCRDRDLVKRKQIVEAATRSLLKVPTGPCRIFPKEPPPDAHEIREAAHLLQDAERRLVQEFFWFWPYAPGQAASDDALWHLAAGDQDTAYITWRAWEEDPVYQGVASHNRAVLLHFLALSWEKGLISGQEDAGAEATAENQWRAAFQLWTSVVEEDHVWRVVSDRIRAMDDQSLSTGASRRLRRDLPAMLLLVNARLALRAASLGSAHHALRHVNLIRSSGFSEASMDEALRLTVEPVRSAIKTLCETAQREAKEEPEQGDAASHRLMDQAAPHLETLDLLLPPGHPARSAEHDQVALAALACQIPYGNKTENWARSVESLDRILAVAASDSAKERINQNRTTVQANLDFHKINKHCWFCGDEESEENCGVELKMCGEVERQYTFYPQIRITWKHASITVPRCGKCKQEMLQAGNMGCAATGLGLLAFVGVASILANTVATSPLIDREPARLALYPIALVVILILAFAIAGRVTRSRSRPGIVKRSQNEFPRIKELLGKGWSFGEKPAGVE